MRFLSSMWRNLKGANIGARTGAWGNAGLRLEPALGLLQPFGSRNRRFSWLMRCERVSSE
jgi:hypothetical protein